MHKVLERIVKQDFQGFFLIAGPCAVESYEVCARVAERLMVLTQTLDIPYVFKASFKKANRTSGASFSTIGIDKALTSLSRVRAEFAVPILTDVHETGDLDLVKEVADFIQIPAFLCRQTDLILAAAQTQKVINIKKGQFMNGEAMKYAVEKVRSVDNQNCFLTERGNSFGYSDLVVDFTNIPILNRVSSGAIMDCTHAVQKPNQSSGITGGDPASIHLMMRAGLISGAKGLFVETHPSPQDALSDGANMLPLIEMKRFLETAHMLSTSIRLIDAENS